LEPDHADLERGLLILAIQTFVRGTRCMSIQRTATGFTPRFRDSGL
jgi:hypothetical protein